MSRDDGEYNYTKCVMKKMIDTYVAFIQAIVVASKDTELVVEGKHIEGLMDSVRKQGSLQVTNIKSATSKIRSQKLRELVFQLEKLNEAITKMFKTLHESQESRYKELGAEMDKVFREEQYKMAAKAAGDYVKIEPNKRLSATDQRGLDVDRNKIFGYGEETLERGTRDNAPQPNRQDLSPADENLRDKSRDGNDQRDFKRFEDNNRDKHRSRFSSEGQDDSSFQQPQSLNYQKQNRLNLPRRDNRDNRGDRRDNRGNDNGYYQNR